jgi:hypothetical protein
VRQADAGLRQTRPGNGGRVTLCVYETPSGNRQRVSSRLISRAKRARE